MIDALVPFVALLLKSTLIVAMAASLVTTLRSLRISASARHVIWLLAFGAIALLPLLSIAMPQIALVVAYSAFGAALPNLNSSGEHLPDRAGMILVWGIYVFGAAVSLARLVAARLALSALWRRAKPHIGAIHGAELSRTCGARRAVEVRIADAPIAPITWGKRVLLPVGAATWPMSRDYDVLAHELSHVSRRDSLTQLLAAIVRALFWFSPAVWFGLRGLRLEQEHACDERVLGAGAEATAYAETLLDVAAGVRQPPVGMGVSSAMVGRSDLERRIVSVLAPVRTRPLGVGRVGALGAVLLASTASIAALHPVDSARVLAPLGSLSAATSPLQPSTARLAPLPRLTGRIRLRDDPNTDQTR